MLQSFPRRYADVVHLTSYAYMGPSFLRIENKLDKWTCTDDLAATDEIETTGCTRLNGKTMLNIALQSEFRTITEAAS